MHKKKQYKIVMSIETDLRMHCYACNSFLARPIRQTFTMLVYLVDIVTYTTLLIKLKSSSINKIVCIAMIHSLKYLFKNNNHVVIMQYYILIIMYIILYTYIKTVNLILILKQFINITWFKLINNSNYIQNDITLCPRKIWHPNSLR